VVEKEKTRTPTMVRGNKTSTTDLPLVDLGQVVSFVNDIRDKGLETTSLREITQGR
jgi:hypothetical protein